MKGKQSEKILCLLLGILPFIILVLLTENVYPDTYLLDWMLKHRYLGLWLIVIVVAFLKPRLTVFISYSNLIAIILGQILGDVIKERNIARIEPWMDAEQQARLYSNPGFYIWFFTFVGMLIIYAVIHVIIYRRRKNVDEVCDES